MTTKSVTASVGRFDGASALWCAGSPVQGDGFVPGLWPRTFSRRGLVGEDRPAGLRAERELLEKRVTTLERLCMKISSRNGDFRSPGGAAVSGEEWLSFGKWSARSSAPSWA